MATPNSSVPLSNGNGGANAKKGLKGRRKKRVPTFFVRKGVTQLDNKKAVSEAELAIKMAGLKLNGNVYDKFEEMSLEPGILQGILNYGLSKPGPIQQRAIVPIIRGKDAIVQAQSGMGKTAALVISVLQRLDRNKRECQALVIVPTRELAEQMVKVFDKLSISFKVSIGLCAGGTKTKTCKSAMQRGCQVVVGTVGRIRHMLVGDGEGPYLTLDSLKIFALDEADQLLDNNFGKDLTEIFSYLQEAVQVILMSATMPGSILKLAWRFMVQPELFLVRDFQLTLDGIQQYYIQVDEEEKKATLCDIFELFDTSRGMVFCRTRASVKKIGNFLQDQGHTVAYITGDMNQRERDEIMDKFRRGEEGYRVIVTSDLLGRGIDIQQINLVVNFDLPEENEMYIHRVGRAGRYGRKGISLSFVTPKETEEFKELQEFYSTQIEPMPPKNEFKELLNASRAE